MAKSAIKNKAFQKKGTFKNKIIKHILPILSPELGTSTVTSEGEIVTKYISFETAQKINSTYNYFVKSEAVYRKNHRI